MTTASRIALPPEQPLVMPRQSLHAKGQKSRSSFNFWRDGRIWLTTATEEGHSLRAVAFDYETGKLLKDVEVFRLEAVPPKKLQQMLRDAIESVLDLEAFRSEQDREIHDANEIETARQRAMAALGPMA